MTYLDYLKFVKKAEGVMALLIIVGLLFPIIQGDFKGFVLVLKLAGLGFLLLVCAIVFSFIVIKIDKK